MYNQTGPRGDIVRYNEKYIQQTGPRGEIVHYHEIYITKLALEEK